MFAPIDNETMHANTADASAKVEKFPGLFTSRCAMVYSVKCTGLQGNLYEPVVLSLNM